jgi:hypothetical protein
VLHDEVGLHLLCPRPQHPGLLRLLLVGDRLAQISSICQFSLSMMSFMIDGMNNARDCCTGARRSRASRPATA